MPERKPAKNKNKGSSGPLKQAAKRADGLHRTADHVKAAAELSHRQAERSHEKAQNLRRAIQQRTRRPPAEHPPPLQGDRLRLRVTKRSGANKPAPSPPEPQSVLPFSVVGVGGSAGGFEAFVTFLRNLPADSGLAFVLVQHLDPTHESRLSQLLSKVSRMPLTEIKTGTRVEPNHIYVLPANASVVLSEGKLRLAPRYPARQPMPIDVFFRSLAAEQQNRAIGVVLSGTGSDGTLGLAEIKGIGGVTFAQDQNSAKYYGMPSSAISAGAVDFILPPENIAAEIVRLGRHPYVAPKRGRTAKATPKPEQSPAEDLFEERGEELRVMFNLLRARSSVDFSLYKRGTLNRRILRRMALQKVDNLAVYVRYLQDNASEVDALFNDLLINVTGFFRDPHTFQALQKRILPRIVKTRSADVPLRVWSCGCSTGEEAYSLAITIAEFLDKTGRHVPVQIFASDINDRGIERARSGMYHENILLDVSPERLRRYFTKADGFYQITKPIRDMCVFATQNVAVDPPFSNLDLIACRNVLIYLTPVLQRRILPVFHYALKPGGFLMLGNSETIGEFSEIFELVDKKHRIYTKKVSAYRAPVEFESRLMARQQPALPKHPGTDKVEPSEATLQSKVDRLLLSQFSPPGVLINAQMDVLQFRGRTGLFLEHQAGAASLNLLKMVRNELALDLRRVINMAIKTGERAEQPAVEVRFDGKARKVRIAVFPVSAPPENETFFLVVFDDVTSEESEAVVSEHKPSKAGAKQEAREVGKLREELASTKESLQAIIEEQEATNEELKSANEEIQSSNEELQSTNEELETAREELQSTNEELTTLNQELQNRNTELNQLNNDLTNVLASVNIAIIMLGTDLKIRRFTPTAEKMFNLIPSDIGRRIGDLSRNIQMPDLDEAIKNVIEDLATVEREVQDKDGRWYSLRIRPYRTQESRIDGVVLMLFDIDEPRRAMTEAISLVRQAVVALSGELKVVSANESFYKLFKLSPDEVENKRLYDLGKRRWNIPRLRQLLEELLPHQGEIRDFKLEHDFPEIGRRSLMINARRFYEENRTVQCILLVFEDVTPKT